MAGAFQNCPIYHFFIFVVFISDLRRKKGMIPLVNEKLTLAMKLSYPIPVCIYGYTLAVLNNLLISDFIALALTSLGAFLTVKAKIDLGEHHVWTGYRLETTKLVRKGVYSLIKHPLYTGIYIFIFGGILILVFHAPWFLTAIFLLTLAYIMSFLAIIAARETKLLAQEFRDEFLKYQEQVHSFLPLRRFKACISQL